MKLPSWIAKERIFSTVLRVSSPQLQLWTHFDVMDNLLIHITGRKRVKMWPPSDDAHLYVTGSSSEVTDVDHPDPIRYPNFRPPVIEFDLLPGDVLYIPALWFHHVTSESFAVSINLFFRHLTDETYDPKDLYGNRDPLPVQEATASIDRILKLLHSLPTDFRQFYGQRLKRQFTNGLDGS